jgi:copper chaperone CopZ
MKQIFLSIITLCFFSSCSQQQNQTQEQPKVESAAIAVNTVVCDMCSKTITDAVKKIDGVNSISVDVEKKIATVEFISTKTNLASLEKSITDAGYNANDKKRNPDAYEHLPGCCKGE